MTPEDRLRALNSSDRWTVNALAPRDNPFGSAAPARRRQSWKLIFAEIAVVAAVGAIIFGAITLQNRGDNTSNPHPDPIVSSTTPTPSPTVPPPVETPEPPAAPVTEKIVLTLKRMELQSDSGEVVDRFRYSASDWRTEGEKAVAALDALFDKKPTVTHTEDPLWGKFIEYDWDGFVAFVHDSDEFGGDAAFQIRVTASEVNGIPIETPEGFSIGSSVTNVSDFAHEQYGQPRREKGGGSYSFMDPVELEGAEGEAANETLPNGPKAMDGVRLSWLEGETTVTTIDAPARNYGV